MKVHDTIIRTIAAANVAGVGAQQVATKWFGVPVSDISHIVMMLCAIISVGVALATYRRGKK